VRVQSEIRNNKAARMSRCHCYDDDDGRSSTVIKVNIDQFPRSFGSVGSALVS